MNQSSKKYDLEERTARFGESVIILCKGIKPSLILNPIINQWSVVKLARNDKL